MNGLNSLTALGQLDKVPLDMTLEGLRGYGQAQQADKIGLQEMLRKQQFEQQMDPMRLQQMQNTTDMGLQDLHSKKRTNREMDFTSDARMQAEYKGFLQKASDSDVAMATNKWQEMAMSPNPKISAQGRAGLSMTKEFLLAKQGQDAQARVTGSNNATQIKLEQMRIDAGKYAKQQKITVGFQTELSKAQGAAKKLAVVQQYKAMAAADPELEGIKETLDMLEYNLAPQAARELAAGDAKPGAVDIRGVTEGRVPTQPVLPITPEPRTAPAKPAASKLSGKAAEDWVSRAMAANPGMSREQIMEQGRLKGKL